MRMVLRHSSRVSERLMDSCSAREGAEAQVAGGRCDMLTTWQGLPQELGFVSSERAVKDGCRCCESFV